MSQQMKSQTRRNPWLLTVAAAAAVAAVLSVAGLTSGPSALTDIFDPTAAKAAPAAPSVAKALPISTANSAVAPAATSTSVMIMNYAYSPAALTIKVGTKVTWTNMDTAPHTVTVSSGPVKFASPNLQKGESFTYTFTKAGTYSYYCAVHPDMKATVTVTGTTTTPTPTPSTPAPTTPSMPMPSADACGGAQSALDAFMAHFYAAHLETSVGQQVTDALDVDQYVKTHTVLIENMIKPLLGGSQSAVDSFMAHFNSAHLETSLSQQVADALNADQYVKTHTVLIGNMLAPLLGGSSSC